MLKTRAATEASICVCVRMQEHELNINWLQALNIEKKKYSQVCLCLYNRIGTIHIRGMGKFRGLHFLAQMYRYAVCLPHTAT